MKKQLVIAATLLLAACSNETEQLQNKQTELKASIKTLKEKISDEKTKKISNSNTLSALNKELDLTNDTSSTISSEDYAGYFNTYTQAMADAFSEYSAIDSEASALKDDAAVRAQLSAIQTKIKSSTDAFNAQLEGKSLPASYEDIHSQVTEANKEFIAGMNKIVKGYAASDRKTFNKGSAALNEGINKIDSIQFQS
ncbi:hypothetical protein ERX35_003790 [Macrococcus equipercicus]|uniref:Lipoprotein n=1 Tax=Macrococcus equipercicus TaxID=69967 RepID=A0ABQ6RA11_9STAP|nr:hypothetical protein [Macrococcus equipercicus]KAA1040120.1 hypothetical protein ERX35_003790 [Macrococcus equipercicus]